jgi:hypothetical protein
VPREKRKPKGSGGAAPDWGIVVRLANGHQLYYYLDERYVDGRGNPLERWGRLSEAYRFPSEEHARRVAAAMQPNSTAREFNVVRLAPGSAH